jgi:hypothetical protein
MFLSVRMRSRNVICDAYHGRECGDRQQEMFNQSSLFPERTDRVPARFTVETESSMPHLGELSSPDLFSGEHPRKKEVEDRDLMIHAAGGNAEDGDRGRGQGAECRI